MSADELDNKGLQKSRALLRGAQAIGKHDPEFYLGSVVFLVEDTFFKLPRHYFSRKSEVFSAVFALPVPGDAPPDGSSDAYPFKLEGIAKSEFRSFLRVICRIHRVTRMMPSMGYVQWLSVLKLATMWEFVDVRARAISALGVLLSANIIQRILLAKQYHIGAWLHRAYTSLARRDDTITPEEAELLGFETTLKMFQAREEYTRAQNSLSARRDIPGDQFDLSRTIYKVFAADIKEAQYV